MTYLTMNKNLKTINYLTILGALSLVFLMTHCGIVGDKPQLQQAVLPYQENALEPYISAETMKFHYQHHYSGYVSKANRLLKRSDLKNMGEIEVIMETADNENYAEIFNNVGQAWNHAFFWQCLKPNGGGKPEGELAQLIVDAFGSFEGFKKEFLAAAEEQFGSGWVWLVQDGDELKVMATVNAETPGLFGVTPIFVVDVWEHAYYLDHQNRRIEFVDTVLTHLADWTFVASQLRDEG
jgi:superoxide dismutase, Fe-Mn family